MFIIERALNIFTLIYEIENQLRVNESQICINNISSSSNKHYELKNESDSQIPQRSSFVPNQLILNTALINAIKQNSLQEEKKVDERLKSGEPKNEKKKETNEKKTNRIPSFGVIESPNSSSANFEKLQNNSSSISSLSLSNIASPTNPNRNAQQNFVSALSSPNAVFIGSQVQQETKSNQQQKEMYSSSPRLVRVNNNLIDNTFNQQRVSNSGINIGGGPNLVSLNNKYNNTNVNGSNRRTVWPNSNLMANGGLGDPLSSPVSSKSRDALSQTKFEQVSNYPVRNQQINSEYQMAPKSSVARYIEQKGVEGFVSPMGFSPLASPTYRKNFSHGRSGNQNRG
ncbi:putative low complexity [Cryptosporidium bovis]|uniref:putative low complexity n=1 Tax=Cryptosporidium bovis TaxID=310047 RepID=UPI003519EDF5|nr:putative low complexity [Cryptosporidium bovis]